MAEYNKWVAMWGNATSITDQTEKGYSKNLTLRYPVKTVFNGNKLRFTFSNLTGTEAVRIKASVAYSKSDKEIDGQSACDILYNGSREIVIAVGQQIVSDEIEFDVEAGKDITVSIYLEDYTQMNSGVLITGPLSKGFYSYGDYEKSEVLPMDKTRSTNWFYFLNTIDIMTEKQNHAVCCYGDSITAQSWPDYLTLKLEKEGVNNLSVIRRAVSGTRILREYDCITYAAYGLKGAKRFPVEARVSGADIMIIQHGINDIIHPVGTEVNPFRPMSDLPTVKEMTDFYEDAYIKYAYSLGYDKIFTGTLLPILGWRTYADFREDMRNQFNEYLRIKVKADGCIDFDKALCDNNDKRAFMEGYDSGDHLHPSEKAYERMALEAFNMIIKK